jgi:hypothetical protein
MVNRAAIEVCHNVNEICFECRSFTASLWKLRLPSLSLWYGLLRLPLVYCFVYLRLPFTRLGR